MKSIKILLLESEQGLIDQTKRFYEVIFLRAGYSPDIRGAIKENDGRDIIRAEIIHCVICDLSFGTQNGGLLIMRSLIEDFPDLFYIGTSSADYSPRDAAAKNVYFSMFFDKSQIFTENSKYIDRTAVLFREKFQHNTSLNVDLSDSVVSKDFRNIADRREIISVLAQVTFTDHDSDQQLTPDNVRLTPLTGGFSGSKVYRFESVNAKSNIPSVPSVLKISERKRAEIELRNYNRFVKWGLPYTWRVDVLGSGFAKKWGGIAYSFVLSGMSEIKPLTSLLQDGDITKFQQTVDRIFSPNLRRWYGDELINAEENINTRYSSRYFRGNDPESKSLLEFRRICVEIFGSNFVGKEFSVDGERLIEPVAALFGRKNGKYQSCICHGDLNSNNIIISEGDNIIFIDFQETGRGHVFEDFVTLESSVRLNFKEEKIDDWRNYLFNEKQIGMGEKSSELSNGQRLCAHIRSLATLNFVRERRYTYYYAVAAFNFRLLRASITDVQKKRCVCAILAACSHMEELRAKADQEQDGAE